MIIEIGLGLATTTSIVSLYVNWNLMRKTELLETWVETFSDKVSRVQQDLTEIDSTGHFEADDEVGTIFESIKEVITDLNNFTDKESFSEQN
jgi:hypothetical protein|tara:strand:- start:1200 stop:1475 length:276 start_codon:yes stop_codon:yes gene_type:complete